MNRLPNVERLRNEINACQHPRRVYNALLALAGVPIVQQARTTQDKQEAITAALEAAKIKEVHA